MTYHINEIEEFALPLPITQRARRTAQEFASQQPTPQKAEQVRLNTLAVYAVNDYLQMMGIPTDLSVGDSWNPVVRLCADVADLEVIDLGRLECRPVRKHQQTCYVPPEVRTDRIGYVVVQIDESSLEATVLGFCPTENPPNPSWVKDETLAIDELPINQLRVVEDLIDCLNQPIPIPAAPISAFIQRPKVNLSQWLSNVFETGWQTIESLLNPVETDLAFRFRSADSTLLIDDEQSDVSVRRAKLIDLGMQIAGYPVALIVEVIPGYNNKNDIILQVHPTGNQIYLPPLLQLTVLDESGLVFLEAQARSADNYIQLQFSGLPGEQFSVRVALGDASIMEDFVV
jgi:hypothetical protein